MTWKTWSGFACAWAIRLEGTTAPFWLPLPPPATAAAGRQITAVSATRRSTAFLPPRPQSAFERCSPPRLPLPQRALARVPRMLPQSFLMLSGPLSAPERRPQLQAKGGEPVARDSAPNVGRSGTPLLPLVGEEGRSHSNEGRPRCRPRVP